MSIESCKKCGGLYATENMEMFAGTPCKCGTRPLPGTSVGRGNENHPVDQVSESPCAVQGQWEVRRWDNQRGYITEEFTEIYCGEKLIIGDQIEAEARIICETHNASLKDDSKELKECKDALRQLIQAVQTHILCGIPEIKTVDDVIIGMRNVADKLRVAALPVPLASEVEEEKKQTLGEPGGV